MKIAYFDCFAGISGDMVLGSLINAGLPFQKLKEELKKLPVSNYQIKTKKVLKQSLGATKVDVVAEEKVVVRTWTNIENLITSSRLEKSIKEKSREILLCLAEAEATIHQKKLDQVHFHAVGATDCIIDVVGAVVGFKLLGVEEVYSSPVATGIGLTKTEHGSIPIPAPATLEILKEIPIYSTTVPAELATPTGAAIIKSYAKDFGPMPPLKVKSIGYGAGTRDLDIPNVLRVVIGELSAEIGYLESVVQIETNIDDTAPEVYTYLSEKLFEAGALDVWLTPIYMKKNRPATAISVLAPPEKEEGILDCIFRETSTLGVRIKRQLRRCLERKTIKVKTKLGPAQVKIGSFKNKPITIAPEYEDCARLAKESGLPLKEVYKMVEEAARKRLEK